MGLSKAVTLIGVSSVVLVAVAIAVAVTLNKNSPHGGGGGGGGEVASSNKAAKVMCDSTDYKDACVKSLSSSNSEDPKELIKTSFKAAVTDLGEVIGKSKTLEDASNDPRTKKAYGLCKELLDTAIKDFDRSADRVGKLEASKMEEYVADVKTWLTGAIDYQETCIDAFENTTGDAGDKMKGLLKASNELSSNALAMMSDLKSIVSSLNIPGLHRRLFDYDYQEPIGDPPPSEDPGTGASSGSRRLFDYDYQEPIGDPPPSEDPGTGASSGSRRLFDYDYQEPIGDPPPSEDPGTGASSGSRRLFDYDYQEPIGDPPPSEDPGTGASAGSRRLFDAASGNNSESRSNNGNISHDSEHIAKARRAGGADDLPEWAGTHQRSLLQGNPKPDAVVALDGSGQFKSINEALKAVPAKNIKAFVILVKAGVYNEYVDVPRGTNNIVMIGEGATKTKVTGNKNFIDGVGTFKTATFAINGDGFMAKDMGFENSAGAAKHQAVALRVSGDRGIFFQCQMDGYQDTLYTHTYRQFYRDCTITGTIDFIFGDAAVVFQNCKMIVRKPMDNQGCMVTAQGRKDSRSTGGNILQNCQITAEPAFMQTKPPIMSYLGRPWKEFSRTVVMQSFIDTNIVPEGWSPWTGNFGQDTCYYVEYQNRGPGSDTSKRVAWKGIQKNVSPQVISQFTAAKFLQGDAWIPVAGIPYDPGMMKV